MTHAIQEGVQEMALFEHSGLKIYYEEAGHGEPLLIMPGWGGTIDELMPMRQALSSSYRVIAADVPGCGKSMPQPREYTPTYYQDDARSFLAMLKALNASPAHVVGFSDGGEYALVMAATEPSAVKSLATWGAAGTLPNLPQMAEAMSNLIDAPIPPMQEFSSYMKATYGEANARAMTTSFGQNLLAMMKEGGDISRSRAASISCPALLITGENDFLATPALVSDMAGAIAKGEFLEAKGASHPVHHEQGDWLIATITGWLAKRGR
jgi:valacyclovir hydrolase